MLRFGGALLRRPFSAAPAQAITSLRAPVTDLTTLPSGLRVASETLPGETATVGLYINAGSRFETAQTNGVAHFLEHLTFKGTPSLTQRDLELSFEDMGGHLNAYTSREHTVYYAKVFKRDVGRAVAILGDILQNSKLEESAIEYERGTILREQQEVESVMEEVVFDQLHATAYQTSSLGRTILGPAENIMSIKRDQLVNYVKTHYTAPRVVLAGAGAVDHAELVALAGKHLNKFAPAAEASPLEKLREPAVYTGSDVRIEADIPLVHLAVAVEGPGWTSPDTITFLVMQTLLGSWNRTAVGGKNLSSQMCQRIAEQNLAHSVAAFNSPYADTGLFGVYATAEEGRLDDLLYEIQTEWVRMCHSVSPAELARAKNQLKTSLLVELDGTSAICEEIGRQLLTFGRRIPITEIFARIDAVTEKTIIDAGQRYIFDKDPVLAAIGHLKSLPDYNKIRRWTYWLRN